MCPAVLRADVTICPGRSRTEVNPLRYLPAATRLAPSFARVTVATGIPAASSQGSDAAAVRDLALPLSIGPGRRQSRTKSRPGAREKSDPSLQAKGSDHLDDSYYRLPA